MPVPDHRFSVVAEAIGEGALAHQLSTLGVSRYMDYSKTTTGIPASARKTIFVGHPETETADTVAARASALPGAVWYIMAEPNVWGLSPSGVIPTLHRLYGWIKSADPTAKVTSPAVLNWDFTCLGNCGYPSGHSWIDSFRTEYLLQMGMEPPVDIWAMDVFPLDWTNLPTVNSDIAIAQIDDFRSYLDQNGLNQPIWIMEFGLHWGWPAMDWSVPGCIGIPSPSGIYATEEVKNYLRTVFSWLTAQPESDVGAWFIYATYRNIWQCSPDNNSGFSLMADGSNTAPLTEIGEFVKQWIAGFRP